jgi:hypothetical protein
VAPQGKGGCAYCGRTDHGSSQAGQQDKCRPLGKCCNGCRRIGHFTHCCPTNARAVKNVTAVVAVKEEAQTSMVTGAEEGSFF